MANLAIKVENLSKSYRINHQRQGSRYKTLREELTELPKRFLSQFRPQPAINNPPSEEEFWALRDLSFDIQQGEVVGIIGRNGAGKSTLLKILSRITEPTKGRIEVFGRIASLLEVGTGFHQELTGRENIFLNGAILGMGRAEIQSKFDEIVAFAEVEKFLDTPVKRYSSGMYVRLAFAVAAHLEPEILIVDEVLSVGDAVFQKKCLSKMEDVAKQDRRTILFVSHQIGAIRQLCTRTILLQKGKLELIGPTEEVIRHYLSAVSSINNSEYHADERVDKEMFVSRARSLNVSGQPTSHFSHNEPVLLCVEFRVRKWVPNAEISFFVCDSLGRRIFTSIKELSEGQVREGKGCATATIPPNVLVPGQYVFTIMIFIFGVWLDYLDDAVRIDVMDAGSRFSMYEGMDYGCVFVDCGWDIGAQPPPSNGTLSAALPMP